MAGQLSFWATREALADEDLTWLLPTHPAYPLLVTYAKLLSRPQQRLAEPTLLYANVGSGVFDAALAIAAPALR